MAKKLIPTNKLRWVKTWDEEEYPTAQIPGYGGPTFFKLEQFWAWSNDSESGEWRDVEIKK